MENKHEFDGLTFTELMMRPKPQLCDYIMLLREAQTLSVEPKPKSEPKPVRPVIEYQQNDYHLDFDVVEKKESADPPKRRRGRKKKNS